MIGRRLTIALAMLALSACASWPRSSPPAASKRAAAAAPGDAASAQAQMSAAQALFDAEKFQEGAALLTGLIGSSTFDSLSSADRYQALELAGKAELALGQKSQAYSDLGRAAQRPESSYEDVALALHTADQLRDPSLEIEALGRLVSRWPDRIGELKDEYLIQILMMRDQLPHGALLPLLEALYDAHWRLRFGIEPSDAWRDLALLLIEKGKSSRAIEVAAHITDPYVLVSIRADRRFEPVTVANPARFDVMAAQARRVEELQSKDGEEHSLEVKGLLIGALLDEQRNEVALAIADSADDDIRSTNFPERLYTDYDEEYADFLRRRAIVLEHVGRYDDALAQLTEAAPLFERGRDNVDDALDLAQLQCDLGHPAEALRAIAGVSTTLSPFGLMQLQLVRLDAASQLGDSRQVKRSLAYLAKNRLDAAATYLSALLTVNDTGAAAHELIGEIRDPGQRPDALTMIQDYRRPPGTARELEHYARWRTLLARPDVLAEIDSVGRVESYALESPFR